MSASEENIGSGSQKHNPARSTGSMPAVTPQIASREARPQTTGTQPVIQTGDFPRTAPNSGTGTMPRVPTGTGEMRRVSTGSMPRVATGEVPVVQQKSGGMGCWITGFVTLLVVGGLIAVGLFLPPISLYERLLGAQYTPLVGGTAGISEGGLNIALVDSDASLTVEEPFAVSLASLPMETFINTASSTTPPAWAQTAYAAVPPGLAVQSPVYTVETRGTPSGDVALSIEIPMTAGDADLLDLYGWDETAGVWTFVPSQKTGNLMISTVNGAQLPEHLAIFQAMPPDQPRVVVAVDVTQVLSTEAAGLATIVTPAGLQPTLDGSLTGSLAAGFETGAGYLVMPALRNYSDPRATDSQTVAAILGSSPLRAAHAAQVANFTSAGYDGVMIDYRDIAPEQRDDFTRFIADLSDGLANSGLLLGVTVPMAENVAGTWMTGAYDWRGLGASVDILQIEMPVDPAAFAPGEDRYVQAMIAWAVGEVSREKLVMGLSARSTQQVGGAFTPIGYDEALSALGDVVIESETTAGGTILPGASFSASLDGFNAVPGADTLTNQPYIEYQNTDGTAAARMWLTTPGALRYRMDRAIPFAVSGIAFNDLLANGIADGIAETILNYKMTIPAQTLPTELALRWTIQGADGVISEVTTGLNEPLRATIEAPDGNYAVNVAVVGGQAETRREGAAVAVFVPTATPTPLPTATPTAIPLPTSIPLRVAAAPEESGGALTGGNFVAAAAPSAGSIVGGFEYGGHVTGTGTSASGSMRSAGMTWMKVQIRYSPGASPGIAADAINAARGQGFKVLLGLMGYPGDLAAGGAGYVSAFAQWAGGVAGLGPDAVEIWNEPNIDREWPRDQISGAAYAEMLRQAYQAVKAANSSVMVISGAPAPTGAEAAFPGQVVNDDNFIRDMLAAGAANYMDCMGAHYNEGIVAPSARSGDPRDSYYTRYFFGMLDTYWNLIGGARPICFTELGYLTPEGFGGLDPYFGWAQNTSVSQQAAWLAEAAALASQSGRVRLLIVWNVDFSNYGADPMAGYAIIRPGGGCPACSTMAGAR